ncbi:MAG TPA: FAD-binding oxidoreductase [Candidatus Binatia bacterium]
MSDATTIVETLAAALPPGRVVTDAADLRAHAHDYWALEAIRDRGPEPAPAPPCVVYPESTDEVARVLAIADERRVPVVPYGLGSGVCGGVRPGREAIVLDMRRMSALVDVNGDALTATVQAGLNGAECERLLSERGFTLGHFPQSIALSSVGGWVSTRASGQLSTRYGNIEDLVLALEVVLPGGKVLRTFPAPRAATGPDLRQLFLGAEGTLGVVTEITLKISPKPDWQQGFAATLASWDDGIEISREILQAGWRPAVLRLYDEVEAQRNFGTWVQQPAPLLLVMSEGTAAMTPALEAELEAARAACRARGGTLLGEEPLRHWLAHRNQVPSWDALLAGGLVVDTIEVAATWDRVRPLHRAVTDAIKAVPGIIAASGHTSHGYTTGVNIYFTFVGTATAPDEQERIYRQAWTAAMETSIASGATIAHHHGIGRVRRDWLPRELGESGMAVLRAVKAALDPHGIMNPGVLL